MSSVQRLSVCYSCPSIRLSIVLHLFVCYSCPSIRLSIVLHLFVCYSCPSIRLSVFLNLSGCYLCTPIRCLLFDIFLSVNPALAHVSQLFCVSLSVIPALLNFRPLSGVCLFVVPALSSVCLFPASICLISLASNPSVCCPSSVQYIYYPCPPIRLSVVLHLSEWPAIHIPPLLSGYPLPPLLLPCFAPPPPLHPQTFGQRNKRSQPE
jgi:hypothetical protein